MNKWKVVCPVCLGKKPESVRYIDHKGEWDEDHFWCVFCRATGLVSRRKDRRLRQRREVMMSKSSMEESFGDIEIDRQPTDTDVLREALEIIKSGYPRGGGSFLDRVQMKEIAVEALNEQEDK